MERPSHWPPEDHPLLQAARENDERAEQSNVAEAIEAIGLDLATTHHLASQRTMRAVMAASRGTMHSILAAAYLDGIAIGWRGHQLELERKESDREQ